MGRKPGWGAEEGTKEKGNEAEGQEGPRQVREMITEDGVHQSSPWGFVCVTPCLTTSVWFVVSGGRKGSAKWRVCCQRRQSGGLQEGTCGQEGRLRPSSPQSVKNKKQKTPSVR